MYTIGQTVTFKPAGADKLPLTGTIRRLGETACTVCVGMVSEIVPYYAIIQGDK